MPKKMRNYLTGRRPKKSYGRSAADKKLSGANQNGEYKDFPIDEDGFVNAIHEKMLSDITIHVPSPQP